jgi:hypothetical protein
MAWVRNAKLDEPVTHLAVALIAEVSLERIVFQSLRNIYLGHHAALIWLPSISTATSPPSIDNNSVILPDLLSFVISARN